MAIRVEERLASRESAADTRPGYRLDGRSVRAVRRCAALAMACAAMQTVVADNRDVDRLYSAKKAHLADFNRPRVTDRKKQ